MRYHIVGIAGAGMSAVANILLDQGHAVSGSDPQANALTAALESRGARVLRGHAAAHVAGADALVVTSALPPGHVEVEAARALGLPVLKRADLWAEWSRQRPTVAVAGTHGKTTTTAMVALALTRAGLDPGYLIGGEPADLPANARWGSPTAPLVIEADEYDRAFLALRPAVAVVTNVELDHVDIYADSVQYDEAFRQFVDSVPARRNIIVCGDDAGALRAAERHPDATHYGIDDLIAADPASCRLAPLDWSAARVATGGEATRFEVWRYDRSTFATRIALRAELRVPGEHNVRNALAALAACAALGVPPEVAGAALAEFRGTRRRFELKGEAAGVTVVDDYGHHPTEVAATLAAARQRFPGRRIVAYLQPHTYSRTRALMGEWPAALAGADVALVGDIYAARERDTLGVSAGQLAEAAGPRAEAVGGVAEAAARALELLRGGDVLVTLGAGDGHQVGERVLAELRARVL